MSGAPRRIFTIAIILALAGALAPARAADVKLTLWRLKTYIPPADKILDTTIQDCAKKIGAEVQIQTYTFDDMWTKYTAAIESKTLPDIAELDAVGPARLAGESRAEYERANAPRSPQAGRETNAGSALRIREGDGRAGAASRRGRRSGPALGAHPALQRADAVHQKPDSGAQSRGAGGGQLGNGGGETVARRHRSRPADQQMAFLGVNG